MMHCVCVCGAHLGLVLVIAEEAPGSCQVLRRKRHAVARAAHPGHVALQRVHQLLGRAPAYEASGHCVCCARMQTQCQER